MYRKSPEIKDAIIQNKKIFQIEKDRKKIFGKIKKNIKDEKNIDFSIIQIITENDYDIKKINCQNFNDINHIKIIKNNNIQYANLNNTIKKNLKQINDIIHIKDNNKHIYILLCLINFEKEIFENINVNNKINYLASEIEIDMNSKHKILYNFKSNE